MSLWLLLRVINPYKANLYFAAGFSQPVFRENLRAFSCPEKNSEAQKLVTKVLVSLPFIASISFL